MITIEQIMEQIQTFANSSINANKDAIRLEKWNEERAKLLAMIEQYRKEAVPDGWQIVPVEPTDEMSYSAKKSMAGFGSLDGFATIYKSMLSAAPKPKE